MMMKTFTQFLEDAAPPPVGAPGAAPGGAPPMGGPPMGGAPPMGGPPMGGAPPMGGPPGTPGGGGQAPMKLKSTNVWDVLEKYLNGRTDVASG